MRRVVERLSQRAFQRRLIRAVPVVGMVVSALWIVRRIRQKGVARGALDVALDVTPVVGRIKAVYEAFFGDVIQPAPPRAIEGGAAPA